MFESVSDIWNDLMEIREARWIMWITILVIAVLIAVYVAKAFRDMAIGGGGSGDEPLNDVEAFKATGLIFDEEYETMKSKVARQALEKTTEPPEEEIKFNKPR